ncbi:Conserved_hypothetical protein [Hexamita inflata]|uniref:Uncharacterized protein n=1 Tax=Hexamita inflata TaxID=28002 RepID=A0ABP1IKN6_9EUKA
MPQLAHIIYEAVKEIKHARFFMFRREDFVVAKKFVMGIMDEMTVGNLPLADDIDIKTQIITSQPIFEEQMYVYQYSDRNVHILRAADEQSVSILHIPSSKLTIAIGFERTVANIDYFISSNAVLNSLISLFDNESPYTVLKQRNTDFSTELSIRLRGQKLSYFNKATTFDQKQHAFAVLVFLNPLYPEFCSLLMKMQQITAAFPMVFSVVCVKGLVKLSSQNLLKSIKIPENQIFEKSAFYQEINIVYEFCNVADQYLSKNEAFSYQLLEMYPNDELPEKQKIPTYQKMSKIYKDFTNEHWKKCTVEPTFLETGHDPNQLLDVLSVVFDVEMTKQFVHIYESTSRLAFNGLKLDVSYNQGFDPRRFTVIIFAKKEDILKEEIKQYQENKLNIFLCQQGIWGKLALNQINDIGAVNVIFDNQNMFRILSEMYKQHKHAFLFDTQLFLVKSHFKLAEIKELITKQSMDLELKSELAASRKKLQKYNIE